MGRLYLIYDLSPSCPWLFSTILANRERLHAHNIEFGPFYPWSCELVPSHLPFWNVLPENGAVPPYLSKMLAELTRQLESGKDALLLSWAPNILAHQSFVRLWRRYSTLAKHDVRILFILGRPACVLEQRYREARSLLTDKLGLAYANRYGSLSALVSDAHRKWGKDRVNLLANVTASPVAQRQDTVAQEVFDFLGCSRPLPLRHTPRHPLCLASHTARRLSWALEVRDNAWPRMDEGLFMDSLKRIDCQWGTEAVSPKSMRELLIRNGADSLRELEEMLQLKTGSLDCPDWLANQQEVDFEAPLSSDRVKALAAALPRSVRVPLRQRYAADAVLLSDDQKQLAEALASVDAVDGMTIGTPTPPPALTVLTMTYNHEKYIAQCMDSVLAQRTDFPVQHIVLDHHSTDNTPNIVAAYAENHPSIQPVLLSRRRPSENVTGLFLRCRSPYVAICDGDDYFTDPLKLQKQVDFLESHPHCVLCFHPVAVVFENGDPPGVYPPPTMLPRGMHEEYYLADMLQGNLIQTNSVVYRWRFRDGLPDWFDATLCPGDWYWHLLHAETGKIGFLPELMSVYRRHNKALYIDSFKSPREHRRRHGMAELKTYYVVNQHFHNRYFRRMADLASGVFANFLEIYTEEGDSSLLDQASTAFPEFAAHFLQQLKFVKASVLKKTPASASSKG